MKFLPSQCRAARGLLAMTQANLASKSGVSLRTVINFEAGKGHSIAATRESLRCALEGAGIVFIDGDGPGARLKGSVELDEDLPHFNLGSGPTRLSKPTANSRSTKNMLAKISRAADRAAAKSHAAWRRKFGSGASKQKG